MNSFLYKKQVDWSLMKDGFTLPVALHPLLRSRTDLQIKIGEKRPISILIDGKLFSAQLINSNFDREKYPDHKEIIQIRYSPNSPISQYFRQIFETSYRDISAQKELTGKRLAASSQIPEYFCLYATENQDTFVGEAITAHDLNSEKTLLANLSEQEWEEAINSIDTSAKIVEKMQLKKLRYLDRSIADGLKSLYKYKCQICKCSFGKPYGSDLIHAHHIDPFVKSLNNNPENIMVLCPNHHGIIHDIHPEFDFGEKVFHYPNGFTEPLRLNLHL